MEIMTEKELITMLIDNYSSLQRIIKSENAQKEAEYQLKLVKAKLESCGIVTSDLDSDN